MTKSLQTPGGICANMGLIEDGRRAAGLAFGGMNPGPKAYTYFTVEPKMCAVEWHLNLQGDAYAQAMIFIGVVHMEQSSQAKHTLDDIFPCIIVQLLVAIVHGIDIG